MSGRSRLDFSHQRGQRLAPASGMSHQQIQGMWAEAFRRVGANPTAPTPAAATPIGRMWEAAIAKALGRRA